MNLASCCRQAYQKVRDLRRSVGTEPRLKGARNI